jgi:hypothetical protein
MMLDCPLGSCKPLPLVMSDTAPQIPFLANMGNDMGEIRTLFSAEVTPSRIDYYRDHKIDR